ncbi:MAG: PDZ domain-containing protein [Planctomycetes bacterium]|nr:PDZ domain-containing protein [Planctomycetota bacterium]
MSRSLWSRCALAVALLPAAALAAPAQDNPIPKIPLPPGIEIPQIEIPQIDGLPQEVQNILKQMLGPAKPATLKWGGAKLKKPGAALLEQLNLPDDQGLIIASVEPGSTEAKAGLKDNDLLLRINNQSVPADPQAFAKFVEGFKADASADLKVLRKGKEQVLRNVKLARVAEDHANPFHGFGGILGNVQVIQQGPGNTMKAETVVNGAKLSRTQEGDDFTGEYSKDKLKIVVTGKLIKGAVVPGLITVHEDKEIRNYQNMDQVPEKHKDAARQVMQPIDLRGLGIPELENLPGLPGLPPRQDF